MKKENKNGVHMLFTILMSIFMIAIVCIVFASQDSKDNNQPVQQEETTVAGNIVDTGNDDMTDVADDIDSITTEAQTTSELPTEAIDDSTTEDATVDALSVIKGGYWYLYDEENVICYTFSFKDNGEVDLTLFDDSNISGEDAQYYKGYSTYVLNGNRVEMHKLPKNFEDRKIDLVIDGNNLQYEGNNLGHHDELSIEYAIGFKMASNLKNMG